MNETQYYFSVVSRSIIIILFSLFVACNTSQVEQERALNYIKTLTFDTGFNGGMQIEIVNGQEFACISNFTTHKKIVAHSLSSDERHVISLQNILDLGEKINGYECVNFDTILVLTTYTNKVYFINEEGLIWKTLDLNPYLNLYPTDGIGFHLSVSHSSTPFLCNDTTVFFAASGYIEQLRVHVREGKMRPESYHFAIYRDSLPHLFRVDNIYADTLQVQFGLKHFYQCFVDSLAETIEGHYFNFYDDHIITTSAYSDTLYIIDYKDLEIHKKVKLSSRFSEVYVKPITTYVSYANEGAHNANYLSDGNIMGVLYDVNKQLYYCPVMHKPLEEEMDDFDFSWSIIVLDNLFNQLEEIKMDKTKYGFKTMVTEEGLLILNNRAFKEDEDFFTKNRFALFRYE